MFRFEVADDLELQDNPLQIRVMDYDTYSANDAIGKVYVDLNPLLLNQSSVTGFSAAASGTSKRAKMCQMLMVMSNVPLMCIVVPSDCANGVAIFSVSIASSYAVRCPSNSLRRLSAGRGRHLECRHATPTAAGATPDQDTRRLHDDRMAAHLRHHARDQGRGQRPGEGRTLLGL